METVERILAFAGHPAFQAVVGFATLVALIIALVETRNSRRLAGDLRNQGELMDRISQSVSTKVIGPFPEYLETLSEILAGAKSSLCIVCPYPEHACFSCPDHYPAYEAALMAALRNSDMSVSMSVTTGELRLKHDREQFHVAHDKWDNWVKDNRTKLDLYYNRHSGTATNVQKLSSIDGLKSAEDWHRFQEACEQAALARWKDADGKFELTECSEIMPIFIWIVDGKEAVFTIMGYDENGLGYAVHTLDKGLVDALKSLCDRYNRMK